MDRARLVPQEQKRASRMEWMLATVEAVLGQNRNVWPLPVALAVPVEMIEAWIVRARREAEPQPTPQWKELAAEEEKQSGHTDRLAFYEQVVRELDADALAARGGAGLNSGEKGDDDGATPPRIARLPPGDPRTIYGARGDGVFPARAREPIRSGRFFAKGAR